MAQEVKDKVKETLSTAKSSPCNVVTMVLIFGWVLSSFFIGVLYTQNYMMKKGNFGNPLAQLGLEGFPAEVVPNGNNGNAGNPPSAPQPPQLDTNAIPPITNDDYRKGNPNSKLVLLEYSDLQCPFCESFHATAQQALAEYEGELSWVYRHLPLEGLHPQAKQLAVASECAAQQGGNNAFWSYIDAVFANFNKYTNKGQMTELAGSLGLDTTSFEACLDDQQVAQSVADEATAAFEAGITGTPGNFIINTETGEIVPLAGAVPFETLKAEIEKQL